MIPFNKPFLTGNEIKYIQEAVESGKISGNGIFTKRCHHFFESEYGFNKTLLTTSCTDALEMIAILLRLEQGDEIIVPSYTFVSTANAFILHGAKVVFADSNPLNPNIDVDKIEHLISNKTKAIVVVHYAGIACDMEKLRSLAEKYKLVLIEDSAQAMESYYKSERLGSIGDFAAFSFHETKNIISGEGGLLVLNNPVYEERSEIIWEKGTNRTAFQRGEVNKYHWKDIGSSYLPSEVIAAFLYSQLENIPKIQSRRIDIWNKYNQELIDLQNQEKIKLPHIPAYGYNNGHMFYFTCRSLDERNDLLNHLKSNGILAVFHYLSLHKSDFFKSRYKGNHLKWSDFYSDSLIRLPLFYELTEEEQAKVVDCVFSYFKSR
ncbi:MAG: dTDP-4-amino-4,6-dideoxygalactose transaminase [bacterium]|nr:dTDP-4-amino-4,6-dideoxygalactose transaminase [bacterium]